MKKTLCILLLLIGVFISCKKKPKENEVPEQTATSTTVIDTLKPLSYLPVFPGSYWKYITSSNDTVTYTTSATYEKDSYEDYKEGKLLKKATAYVPRYNDLLIWGYDKHTGPILNYSNVVAYSLISVLRETIGATWPTYAVGHIYNGATVITKDTSIVILGKTYFPTLVVYYTGSYSGSKQVPMSKEYYTKDIGLVKREQLKFDGTLASEMHLVDYYINK